MHQEGAGSSARGQRFTVAFRLERRAKEGEIPQGWTSPALSRYFSAITARNECGSFRRRDTAGFAKCDRFVAESVALPEERRRPLHSPKFEKSVLVMYVESTFSTIFPFRFGFNRER